MKTYEQEFEPGQDNPEDRPTSRWTVFFSWFFVAGVVGAIIYGFFWLHAYVVVAK